MANEEHLAILRQGVDAWNAWRGKEYRVSPDLIKADLSGAELSEASLWMANLTNADLGGANLYKADLGGANLRRANLRGADLSETNLSGANLSGAHLRGGDLSRTDLREVDLSEADLREVDLRRADLRGANLREVDLREMDLSGVDLRGANLSQANLIDARLGGADLTDAKLWETQRGGWSIKDVICQRAFWDREGKEPTKYEEGEFERIFAEKPRIVLHYDKGIRPIDLLALPVIVERLQADYPDSVLQVRSVQNDAGGASVTITIEDLAGRSPEAVAAEIEKLRTDLLAIQDRLHNEEKLRLSFEAQCQVLVERVIPILAAAPKQQVNIGHLTAPMTIEGTIMNKGDTNINTGLAAVVGRSAHVHDSVFQQNQTGIDLPKLAEELGRLHAAMKGETTGTREQDKAIVAVADAEEAAVRGNGPAALRYLKSAGEWTLGIAEKIGVAVAIEALKRAM